MTVGIILSVLVFVAIIAFIIIFMQRSSSFNGGIEPIEVDSLGMREIITFFKSPGNMAKIKEKESFIAVAIKESSTSEKTKITACIFDKDKGEVVFPLKAWNVKIIEPELKDAFGDKSMLVLQ